VKLKVLFLRREAAALAGSLKLKANRQVKWGEIQQAIPYIISVNTIPQILVANKFEKQPLKILIQDHCFIPGNLQSPGMDYTLITEL